MTSEQEQEFIDALEHAHKQSELAIKYYLNGAIESAKTAAKNVKSDADKAYRLIKVHEHTEDKK